MDKATAKHLARTIRHSTCAHVGARIVDWEDGTYRVHVDNHTDGSSRMIRDTAHWDAYRTALQTGVAQGGGHVPQGCSQH